MAFESLYDAAIGRALDSDNAARECGVWSVECGARLKVVGTNLDEYRRLLKWKSGKNAGRNLPPIVVFVCMVVVTILYIEGGVHLNIWLGHNHVYPDIHSQPPPQPLAACCISRAST